ncbi:hypothetical protein B0J11DRAFT_593316 [Dendryphion nanum]|uniref:Apple domain-containing protein n=1 Tax=Dendryphion nanum TaxID=256645 RepID=A0A9P9DE82_9PLEO|nr:hypothetical protein B0J11DRAFT_593316 [Dendryphion nanum]
MLTPTFLAAFLAAAPSVLAQGYLAIPDVTSSFTRCTTKYGNYALPTGSAGPPTWFVFTTTTNTFSVVFTTRETVSVTPEATTFTGVATSTSIVTATSFYTPPTVTVPTPAGFLALRTPDASPIPRIKRLQSDVFRSFIKRQTLPGYTSGFDVNPDGTLSDLTRIHPHKVLCEVKVTVNHTEVTVESGAATTITLPQSTATLQSTTTVVTTSTVRETLPTPSVYAACAENNVVNHFQDPTGRRINLRRVDYLPREGLPIGNELITNTTNAINCCVACQNTANCAGSGFIPSIKQCRLRLTVTATLNGTLPIAPSGTAPSVALATGSPSSCPSGSDSLFIGAIRGQLRNEFRDEFAVSFSNGPCGRFVFNPVPIQNRPVQMPQKL